MNLNYKYATALLLTSVFPETDVKCIFFSSENNNGGRGRGRNQFDKSNIECCRCHKFGHYRFECYTKLPRDREKKVISKFVEENEVETRLMAVQNREEPKSI